MFWVTAQLGEARVPGGNVESQIRVLSVTHSPLDVDLRLFYIMDWCLWEENTENNFSGVLLFSLVKRSRNTTDFGGDMQTEIGALPKFELELTIRAGFEYNAIGVGAK